MKRKRLLFIVMIVMVLSSVTGTSKCYAEGIKRPKLVVGIVVDQMRWDYLYRYYGLYGDGGFKRLMREGFKCENTMINYLPSYTAVGHASVYTGTVPAVHGIVGNTMFLDGKATYCCTDNTVGSVGTDTKAGQMSPHNMLSTTIGDELKTATDFKSKVIGVALKDRASILPAGHTADGAYWMDFNNGCFVTSTHYMKELPQWAMDFNKTIGKTTKKEIQMTSLGNKLTEEFAKAAIIGEKLGLGDNTDMLTVSFSCTDMIGHAYGTHSDKTRDIFLDVDSRLADLFSFLDNEIGKGEYLVFLTADHGAANNILMMREHGYKVEGFFSSKIENALDSYLKETLHTDAKLFTRFGNDYVFLDHKAIKDSGIDIKTVKTAIIEWLRLNPMFSYAVDMDAIANAVIPSVVKDKMINGHYRQRCGDIRFVLRPGCYEIYGKEIDGGTTHGSWNPYDAHIPFIIMGWNVKPGTTHTQTYITDIAPTICALLHIQMPNGCIGNAVEGALK
ncbi:MAG: alkaline phosphatase family protein [Prevotella sp.]